MQKCSNCVHFKIDAMRRYCAVLSSKNTADIQLTPTLQGASYFCIKNPAKFYCALFKLRGESL